MDSKDLEYVELTLEQYEHLKRRVISLRQSFNDDPNGKTFDELRKLERVLDFSTIKDTPDRYNMNFIAKNNTRKR